MQASIEAKIAKKVLKTVWQKMTPQQRREMEAKLHQTAQEFDKTAAAVGTAGTFAARSAGSESVSSPCGS
jgi:1-aminocyclopropane-1-carboxylate deaminase/D-cysteine desulfhydrase-like pyridoxal-dependent ACC family enzyme